tara:strand:+ start:3790 stop:3984 length:195 start_codon:yes stop_codon:yes gene_type:complete
MSESALTGDDVLSEAISDNLRLQGGMSVNQGGINFANRDNDVVPASQAGINKMTDRFIDSDTPK